MKRAQLAAAAAVIAGAVCTALALLWPAPEPPPHRRVLFFGIDGGSWDVIDPMIAAGELPNLAALKDRGLHGILRSRHPAISPTAWSTIFTGKLPEAHGVDSWQHSHATHRKVKEVWQIASEAGRTVHVFNVPATWPVEEIDGVMVSGFPVSGSHVGGNTGLVVTRSALDGALEAPYAGNEAAIRAAVADLAEGAWSGWFAVRVGEGRRAREGQMKVRALAGGELWLSPFYRTDDRLEFTWPRRHQRHLAGLVGHPYIPEGPGWNRHDEPQTPVYLYDHLVEIADQHTAAVLDVADDPWSMLIYVHTLVDRTSHPYWAYDHPEDYDGFDPARAEAFSGTVADAYREADADLGELLAAIDDPDLFVVVGSDHGFHSSTNRERHIGTHDLDGIYVIAGPGLSGRAGPQVNIEDVAPTLLNLLDLPAAEDMAGRPHPYLERLWPQPPAVATWEADVGEVLGEDDGPGGLPVDQETWEQLRGLGYVEGATPSDEAGVGADDDPPDGVGADNERGALDEEPAP